MPFLIVDPVDGPKDQPGHPGNLVVTGHEGRHRARALAEAGFVTLPVMVRAAHIRWSEQFDSRRWDYRPEWPEKILAQKGAPDPNYRMSMPIRREQAAEPYPLAQHWPEAQSSGAANTVERIRTFASIAP